jgi:hypothetical protein
VVLAECMYLQGGELYTHTHNLIGDAFPCEALSTSSRGVDFVRVSFWRLPF